VPIKDEKYITALDDFLTLNNRTHSTGIGIIFKISGNLTILGDNRQEFEMR